MSTPYGQQGQGQPQEFGGPAAPSGPGGYPPAPPPGPPGSYPPPPGAPGGYPAQSGPQGPPGYGNFPGGMEQPSGPGQRPTRPRTVNIAFILYLVNSALGILGAVILMATMDSLIVAEARAAGLDSEAESVLETFRAAMMITAVIALIFSAVFLLFVFMMRNGRNWARILLTVLSGLALLSTIGSLGDTGSNGLLVGQTMLSIALPIGAIVAMYLPESNRYFKSN